MKCLENTCFHNCYKFPVKILKNKVDITALRRKLPKFPIERNNGKQKQSKAESVC